MPKREVKKYTDEFRREVVTFSREHGRNDASKKYHVAASTVDGWVGRFSNGPVKTLFKVEGLQDFSLNGLLSIMQQRKDEAFELAATYERLVTSLVELETANEKLSKYASEVAEHRKALAVFLESRDRR